MLRARLRHFGVAAALSSALLAATLLAQQPAPTFRSGVEAVVVDVSVLDKDRRPVRGLSADDFTIFENGKAQSVRTFKAIDMDDVTTASARTAPWTREVTADIGRNDELKDRRIVAIVMDSSTPMPVADILYARELANQLVDQLGPDDLAAVIFTFGKTYGQPFTQNRELLRAAIRRFNGTSDSGMGVPYNSRGGLVRMPFTGLNAAAQILYQSTLNTIRDVATDLASVPERRKAIILVSVGIPFTGGWQAPPELVSSRDEALAAAQRGNVSIYGLDPGGLRTTPSPNNQDFLRTYSDRTGGFAIVDTNDPSQEIAQVYRENGSYYLLGYEPSPAHREGDYVKFEVRVNRPDVTVRSRNGYTEATRRERARSTDPIASLMPATGLQLQVHAVPFAAVDGKEPEVAIVINGEQPIPAGSTATSEDIAIRVRVYDLLAKEQASEDVKVHLNIRKGATENMRYSALSRLRVKPGRYQLRVAASSASLGKSGSVYCDLDVPDFSKSLLLSGIMLQVSPSRAVAPIDKLKSLIPIVPTPERSFFTGDTLNAFVRAYVPKTPSRPVVLTTTIVDDQDRKVFGHTETIDPARFALTRAVDVDVPLAIATLSSGAYLLSMTASETTHLVTRNLRFTIR